MVDDRFAVIIPHSIRRYSEARGFEILNDEIADALAEDASYRLREAISLSAQYMKRSRRSTLKPEDVIKALEIYNAPQMIGVERENKPGRMPLEEDIHYLGDDHISVHVSSCLATHDTKNGEASHQVMISKWVRLNGGRFSAEKSLAEIALPDARLDYFTSLVSCILSDNWYHRRESLNDLQENSNISQLIPYFANFALNVKAVSHDICQLSMLLQTVSALISNSNLCLLGYLKSLASSVLYCVLEPLAASINPVNDHWRLRDYGSRILSHMALKHGPKNKDFTCYLCNSVQAILMDPTRPLCSHYGAIVTMSSLGIDAIKSLLCPNLLNYYKSSLRVLEENSDNNNLSLKEDAFKIAGALLYSLQALHADIRKRYQPTHQYQYLIMLLHEMMEIFGSALALRLPIMFFETSAQPRMEKSVSLVRFGPVITKRSPLVIGLLTDGRSLTFGPSKVPNRTISIAVRGHRNRPPKTLPPYCHSDYFSLTLKTASIGRCESLFVKKFGRSVIDLSCITL